MIYDIATSNRISPGLYAAGAGVAGFNLHTVFVTMTDWVVHRILSFKSWGRSLATMRY